MFQFVDGRYKRECIPVGCVPPALYRTVGGGSLSRWVSVRGGLCPGVSVWGRVGKGSGSLSGGVFPCPTPVNRMTDTRL